MDRRCCEEAKLKPEIGVYKPLSGQASDLATDEGNLTRRDKMKWYQVWDNKGDYTEDYTNLVKARKFAKELVSQGYTRVVVDEWHGDKDMDGDYFRTVCEY